MTSHNTLILTPHILTPVCKFSTPFLYISYGTYRENLSNNQELLEFVIISFILITLPFDLWVILLEKLDSYYFKGLNELTADQELHMQTLSKHSLPMT